MEDLVKITGATSSECECSRCKKTSTITDYRASGNRWLTRLPPGWIMLMYYEVEGYLCAKCFRKSLDAYELEKVVGYSEKKGKNK